MAKFDFLRDQLYQYQALDFHQDPVLAQRLKDVQLWQKQRMQTTHNDFFNQPLHRPMAAYFLNRLYGANDFDELALQIHRMIDNAAIVEKIIPMSALKTGDAAVELASLSIQLDELIAKYLLTKYPADYPLNDEIMRVAYLDCNQAEPRQHQMDLLEILGEKLDMYVRSKMVRTAFKLAKGLVVRYRVEAIYNFIDEGFKAMEPLNSAKSFVQVFIAKEREIIHAVHTGHPQPFNL